MPWNPFQFQFTATYLRDDENGFAVLEIKKGSNSELVFFPKKLLPLELQPGSQLALKLEDNETASQGELKTLQKLLSELIQ